MLAFRSAIFSLHLLLIINLLFVMFHLKPPTVISIDQEGRNPETTSSSLKIDTVMVCSLLKRVSGRFVMDTYESLVRTSPVGSHIIDIGLAHGKECFGAASLDRHCWGFEADPESALDMKNKAERHSKSDFIHIRSAAVGAEPKNVQFIRDLKNQWGVGGHLSASNKTAVGSVNIPMVRLDDEIPKERDIFLLKTDTQGHELGVLQGAEGLLKSRRVKLIIMEVSIYLMPGGRKDLMMILELLTDYGFACCDLPWHTSLHRPFTGEAPNDVMGWVSALEASEEYSNGTRHRYFTDLVCELHDLGTPFRLAP